MTKELEHYARFLDPKLKLDKELHWEKARKTVFTLFNALMDQDLSEFVRVLEHFPKYIPLACEHFRYSYSYSEVEADIFAASKLFSLCEPYMTNQFARNVLSKLKKIDGFEASEIREFVEFLAENSQRLHDIVLVHYAKKVDSWMEANSIHILQRVAINKKLSFVPKVEYDFTSQDRDKNLEIPYMA